MAVQRFSVVGTHVLELGTHVQILQVKALENLPLNEAVQIRQIADHSRGLIHRSTDRDFEPVVVPVPVRVIALAVGQRVFLRRT